VTTYAHTQGPDKITVLYSPFLNPGFASLKYYGPFRSLPYEFPELFSVRADKSRLQNPDARSTLTLIAEIANGAPLPQVLFFGDDYLFETELHAVVLLLFRALQEASDGCYELADTFQYAYSRFAFGEV